jgi:hypothetical protein
LLFAKSKDHLAKSCKVLSIEIKEDILDEFIEAKASRDAIIHIVPFSANEKDAIEKRPKISP